MKFFQDMPRLMRDYEQAISGDLILTIRRVSLEMVKVIEDTTSKLVEEYRKIIKGESC